MFAESPSKYAKILVNLREIIQSSEAFKDIPVYFNEHQLNSNTSLPCISFYSGEKKIVNENPYCMEFSRDFEIRLHTKSLDKSELLEELWKYEEDLTNVLNFASINNQIEGYSIEINGSSKLNALMFNARKEGNRTDMSFFSNVIRVFFKIRYSI